MTDKLWHLKSCELFRQLSPEQMGRIEMRSRSRSFAAHSPVYLPAEKADSVFLLTAGLVKVCHLTTDGKESILAFVEPGEMFGELAIFDGDDRDEYVEAIEPAAVLMIPAEVLQQLMAESPGVAMGVTRLVGLRRHRIERRLKNLLFQSNHDRLVHLLLDLAEQFGAAEPGGIRLRVRLTHQDLANLIGSTRETVTVILGRLKAKGVVSGGRRRIVLAKPQALAQSVLRKAPPVPKPGERSDPFFAVC
ncbi:Crp/Fnr family transcriptional regulator [Lignipirellula cremea]|uniref:Global nitrogen regulator n=1 Tax=Lignipirellula cremea TaxID=2528010 RepID=A0A518DXF4_9BACT|nr:Crp/Fnr family transcriptional regulator [Lignipirellula cremea]QDU96500.1 Global nitrogen regulator [Lignipirellula cremea]